MLVNLGGEQLYLFDVYNSNENNTNNFKFKHDSFRKMLNEPQDVAETLSSENECTKKYESYKMF